MIQSDQSGTRSGEFFCVPKIFKNPCKFKTTARTEFLCSPDYVRLQGGAISSDPAFDKFFCNDNYQPKTANKLMKRSRMAPMYSLSNTSMGNSSMKASHSETTIPSKKSAMRLVLFLQSSSPFYRQARIKKLTRFSFWN